MLSNAFKFNSSFTSYQGLKSSGKGGNAVPKRKFDVLVVGTYVPTRRKGLAKFTGALTTNDVSILQLFSKQQTVVSVANSQTFEDQTLQFFFIRTATIRYQCFLKFRFSNFEVNDFWYNFFAVKILKAMFPRQSGCALSMNLVIFWYKT